MILRKFLIMKKIILLSLIFGSFIQMQAAGLHQAPAHSEHVVRDYNNCPICCEMFGPGDEVRLHRCSFEESIFIESFHKDCFDGWQDVGGLNCIFCGAFFSPESLATDAASAYILPLYSMRHGLPAYVRLFSERNGRWSRVFSVRRMVTDAAGTYSADVSEGELADEDASNTLLAEGSYQGPEHKHT